MEYFRKLGENTIYYMVNVGRMANFLVRCIWAMVRHPPKFKELLRQIDFIGSRSLFVIGFTGLFTGMVLGLQGYHLLKNYGSVGALGAGVGLSLVRELGPVLTSLMIIGRAGSAICAEIGIMRNSEQIDALECMAIDPIRFLMGPKFLAMIISLPLLICIFDVVGILGGYLVGVQIYDISWGGYFQSMYDSVEWADLRMGFWKSFCFSILVVWISAGRGYYLHLERDGGFGAEGVSRSTTSAVVISSVSILVWDYLINALMI